MMAQEVNVLLYIQDLGVYGCIVVAAESEEQARQIMVDCYNYDENRQVTVSTMPTKAGLIHCNLGDE
jgi:hypothetical protein